MVAFGIATLSELNARADSRLTDAKPVSGNKIDIKWRHFSFVKINCKHTLMATRRWVRWRQAHTVGDPDEEYIFSEV
jgi:hypothetical protein